MKNNPQGFYVINVGQGDSLLYITKENQTFLIDTGRPGDGIVNKLEKILGKYKKTLDVVLLTHPDSDHVGEIDNILASYKVGLILYSPIYDARPASKKSIEEIKNKNTGLTLPAFAGFNLSFSEKEKSYFLSPSASGMTTFISKKDIAEDNYFSVVSVIKNKDLIFAMADAPQKIEKVLASVNMTTIATAPLTSAATTAGVNTTSVTITSEEDILSGTANSNLTLITGEKFKRNNFDKIILKVGHHGSKTSSAPDFIQKLLPTDAVFSYGLNNRYGHPHQEVVDLFTSASISAPASAPASVSSSSSSSSLATPTLILNKTSPSFSLSAKAISPNTKIHRTISGTVYFAE